MGSSPGRKCAADEIEVDDALKAFLRQTYLQGLTQAVIPRDSRFIAHSGACAPKLLPTITVALEIQLPVWPPMMQEIGAALGAFRGSPRSHGTISKWLKAHMEFTEEEEARRKMAKKERKAAEAAERKAQTAV